MYRILLIHVPELAQITFKRYSHQLISVSCYLEALVEVYLHRPDNPFQVQTSLSRGDNKSEDLATEERLNKRLWIARDGDQLMGIPFECDLCQFRNMNEKDTIHGNSRDNLTLLCTRR